MPSPKSLFYLQNVMTSLSWYIVDVITDEVTLFQTEFGISTLTDL